MDPADFAAHMLPKIEYTEKNRSVAYALYDPVQYNEFAQKFMKYAGGDCHAITLDDEILYNKYKEKSVKETIQERVILNELMDDPYVLFVKSRIKKKDSRVILYMAGDTPWFVAIYYTARLDMLTLEYYKSKRYEEVYQRRPYSPITTPSNA